MPKRKPSAKATSSEAKSSLPVASTVALSGAVLIAAALFARWPASNPPPPLPRSESEIRRVTKPSAVTTDESHDHAASAAFHATAASATNKGPKERPQVKVLPLSVSESAAAAPAGTQRAVASLKKGGFARLEDSLPTALLESLRNATATFVDRLRAIASPAWSHFGLAEAHFFQEVCFADVIGRQPGKYECALPELEDSSVLSWLAREAAWVSVVRNALGADARLVSATVIVSMALSLEGRPARNQSWHADGSFRAGNETCVNCVETDEAYGMVVYVPLADVEVGGGGEVEYVVGSHRDEALYAEMVHVNQGGSTTDEVLARHPQLRIDRPRLKAGTALMYDYRLQLSALHASAHHGALPPHRYDYRLQHRGLARSLPHGHRPILKLDFFRRGHSDYDNLWCVHAGTALLAGPCGALLNDQLDLTDTLCRGWAGSGRCAEPHVLQRCQRTCCLHGHPPVPLSLPHEQLVQQQQRRLDGAADAAAAKAAVVLDAWALPDGAQDGTQVMVASPPLALRSLSDVETIDGVGWQNTPFERVAPSAKRGNPPTAELRAGDPSCGADGRIELSWSQCPDCCCLAHPGRSFPWQPSYGPRTGLALLRHAYVAIDGLVIRLDAPPATHTITHDASHAGLRPLGGVQYAWAGSGVSEMLVASGLATVGAGGLEGATTGKEAAGTPEPLLHVPGGLAMLKVADAVRITRRANLTSPAAARRVEPFWEWYDYPAKLGGGVGRCATEVDGVAAVGPRRAVVRLYGRLAALNRFISASFYHWLVDTLPFVEMARLHEATRRRAAGTPTTARSRLRYLVYGSPFARAHLDLLGIDPEDVITYDPCVLYHGAEVLVPFGSGSGLTMLSKPHYLAVRRALRAPAMRQLPAPAPAAKRPLDEGCAPAVLIVRTASDSQSRSFLSEAPAVMETMRQRLPVGAHESTRVELGALSALEQLALFSRAGLVVGLESGGLANGLFLAEGATLVSLTPTDGRRDCGETCYWHMASAVGVRFYTFLIPRVGWESTDVRVPLDRWGAFLEDLGKEIGCRRPV
jgi:hypothetical protein